MDLDDIIRVNNKIEDIEKCIGEFEINKSYYYMLISENSKFVNDILYELRRKGYLVNLRNLGNNINEFQIIKI